MNLTRKECNAVMEAMSSFVEENPNYLKEHPKLNDSLFSAYDKIYEYRSNL